MRIMTVGEAAAALGISRSQLRRGIQSGKYPAIYWGGRILVDLDALKAIIAAERRVGLKACADQIGMSASTLRRMAQAGLIPYTVENGRYLFEPELVKEALRKLMDGVE